MVDLLRGRLKSCAPIGAGHQERHYVYKHGASDGAEKPKRAPGDLIYKAGDITYELSSQFTVTVVPSANVVRSLR